VAETAGYTPADLRRLFYEAQMYARMEGDSSIELTHLRRAMHSHTGAAEAMPEPPPTLTHTGQRRLAYYQAGQMYVQRRLYGTTKPPATTEPGRTRHELLLDMQMLLAGRVAEEELLGMQTNRAAADLHRATRLAVLLVAAFGMGQQLCAVLPADADDADLAALPEDLREQAEALLHTQYCYVRDLLAHNRAAVTKLAEGLLLHEQAGEAELYRVLAHIEERHPFVGTTKDAPPQAGTYPASTACLYARRAPVGHSAAADRQQPVVEPLPIRPDD
jgi:ATP-dependent Zn protease